MIKRFDESLSRENGQTTLLEKRKSFPLKRKASIDSLISGTSAFDRDSNAGADTLVSRMHEFQDN